MKNPCDECLVRGCCSKPCREYATYVFETKQYVDAGPLVKRRINKMTYDEAIDHILKVETAYFYISNIEENKPKIEKCLRK